MKVVIVFVSVIVGALAHSHHASQNCAILLTEEQKLQRIHDACQANPATSVDHELLHNLAENIDHPQVGAHMLCESVGVGLQGEDGELDLDNVFHKISLTVQNRAIAYFLVRKCAIRRETPEKTAVCLFMCLDRHGVTYFHEF